MIQVPPRPNRLVIMKWQHGVALGAPKPSILPMLNKQLNALAIRLQNYLLDKPRSFQSKQLGKHINIAHGQRPPKDSYPCVHYKSPTRKPEEPNK